MCIFIECSTGKAQRKIDSIPAECEVPNKEPYCPEVTKETPFSVCGVYTSPKLPCFSFCFNLLMQHYAGNHCDEELPSFGLSAELLTQCMTRCNGGRRELSNSRAYRRSSRRKKKRLGVLVRLKTSSLLPGGLIESSYMTYRVASSTASRSAVTPTSSPSATPSESPPPVPEAPVADPQGVAGCLCSTCQHIGGICPSCCDR